MQLLIHVVLFFATALCKNNGSQVKSEELFTVPDPNSLEKGLHEETFTKIRIVRNPQKSTDSKHKNQVPINQDDPPTGTERIKGAAKYSARSPIKESPKILKNTLDDDAGEINNGVPAGKDNVKQFDIKSDQNKDKKYMEKVETAAAIPAKVETAAATPEIVETAAATPEIVETAAATPEIVETSAATPEKAETSAATPEKAETSAATPEKVETSTATPEFICSSLWPECTDPHNATKELPTQLIKFTLNMYKELSQRDETSNLVISPISIALGLSQLMLGSSGETRELMLKILYGGMENPQCVHHVLQNLTKFKSFTSASEIFFNKDFSIKEEFSNQSERFYGSKGIQLQKNTKKKNLVRINNWVSTVTKKLIPSLFKQLPDFDLMLLSVIYYQGKWINQFDPNLTKKENFETASSRSVKVPMMNDHKFPLQSVRDAHLKAQVARFPLSNNYSFIIFLPLAQEKGLQHVESKLTDEILNVLITQLAEKSPLATTISIPQLKLDSEFGLSEILKLLGLADLFENPQFCALSEASDLAISDVHHRAILEIKESGVKAAAATSISVARTMPVFLAQKPFLYILVNDINKIPIVIGRVTDPSK